MASSWRDPHPSLCTDFFGCHQRHDPAHTLHDFLILGGLLEVVRGLKAHPEFRRTAEDKSGMHALPWKSGPSGPRKSPRINSGFIPVGRSSTPERVSSPPCYGFRCRVPQVSRLSRPGIPRLPQSTGFISARSHSVRFHHNQPVSTITDTSLAGCPRSRAFRDLGFHSRLSLGILSPPNRTA